MDKKCEDKIVKHKLKMQTQSTWHFYLSKFSPQHSHLNLFSFYFGLSLCFYVDSISFSLLISYISLFVHCIHLFSFSLSHLSFLFHLSFFLIHISYHFSSLIFPQPSISFLCSFSVCLSLSFVLSLFVFLFLFLTCWAHTSKHKRFNAVSHRECWI